MCKIRIYEIRFLIPVYFEALSGMLLTEMRAPFDNGLGGHSLDGRLSKASSRDSRSASNADLSDTGREIYEIYI